MSVNVSGRQLERDEDLVGHGARAQWPGPAALMLEITETTVAHDPAATAERLLRLKRLGVGIESEAQLRSLRRHHCDQGQGFLFARPLTVEQLETYLVSPPPEALAS